MPSFSTGHAKTGMMFAGTYVFVVAMTLLFVVTSAGGMSDVLIIILALPWSQLGNMLFSHLGVVIGTWFGLVQNAICAYFLGYFLS
jgi:hypothetical protein